MYAFLGHHKCATMWSLSIFRQIAGLLELKVGVYHTPGFFDFDLRERLAQEPVDLLAYTNLDPRYMDGVRVHRGVHVVRDPRDMAVSAYYSHLESHPVHSWPELEAHRERLRALSPRQGLLADMEFTARLPTGGHDVAPWECMHAWSYDHPEILELRYEDMVASPGDCWRKVVRHMGLFDERDPGRLRRAARRLFWRPQRRLRPHELAEILRASSFSALTKGREQGQEDRSHHMRKGVPGDYRSHFREEHKAFFKERYGRLLRKLGYQRDDDW